MTLSVDQHQLFVIHAEGDASWVHGHLLPALGFSGEDPRVITRERFRYGAVTAEEFERAVRTSRHVAVVLSPAFLDDPWAAFGKQLAVQWNVTTRRDDLIPLLLHPCEPPLELGSRELVDFTDEAGWEQAAGELRARLGEPEPAHSSIPCPYPGMAAYGADDATRFFGRDREVDELARRVRRLRYVCIVGPSGSGKSSLVCAGLLPELEGLEPGRWVVRTMRPGPSPMRALAVALDGPGHAPDGEVDPKRLAATLLAGRAARRLLLVVDQLEELFSLATAAERGAFVAALRTLRSARDCVVVTTLRADFYADLMVSPLYPGSDGERFEVTSLRGDDLRRAIQGPAGEVGVYLEPALVERLLDDGDEPGALPLMQETLVLLWERRRHRLLTLRAYESLGDGGESGLDVALKSTADACIAELSPDQREVARRIFLRLIQLGEGREDTRRQQSVAALRSANDNPRLFEQTLRHLTDHRLLTLDGQPGARTSTVDLSHEALIKAWPTLRAWADEGRAGELVRRRVERDAEWWSQNRRDRSGLYRGRRLRDAAAWMRSHPYEPSQHVAAFLAAGRRLHALVRAVQATVLVFVLVGMTYLTVPQVETRLWRQQALRDGPMAAFPAGPAVLGSGNGGAWARRTVRLAGFSLDIHEVTNRQYQLCVRAGRCLPTAGPQADPRLPVVLVSAREAAAFCRWLGRRLPSTAEWERAARGALGRPWPWGDEPPSRFLANVQSGSFAPEGLVAADDPALAAGATPEQVRQLIGNVWEWTATPMDCAPNMYTCSALWDGRAERALSLRGGGFDFPVTPLTAPGGPLGANGNQANASASLPFLGFRCAK